MNHKNIYYKSTLEKKDQKLVKQIKEIHKTHPAYRYIRVAIELGINKKRAQRVIKVAHCRMDLKESLFSRFKEENGDLTRFESLGEFAEEVYSYIDYYNTYRIHTKLKMSPVQFKLKFVESVLEKLGY